MKRILLVAATLLVAVPAAAATKKYKDWAASPEAYFLTAAERKGWEAVSSDEEAEAFVKAYREARGKGFAAAIQSRIEVADKGYGLGKKKGSETLRGRTLILLGAPTEVVQGRLAGNDGLNRDPSYAMAQRGGESERGADPNVLSNAGAGDSLRSLGGAKERRMETTWIYAPGSIPAGDKTKEVVISFEVFPDSGRESVNNLTSLEALFSTVVEYWGPKPAPAK